MRTIHEIIDGHENDEWPEQLSARWKEVSKNLKKYPLVEIYQAKEKLIQSAKIMGKSHSINVRELLGI